MYTLDNPPKIGERVIIKEGTTYHHYFVGYKKEFITIIGKSRDNDRIITDLRTDGDTSVDGIQGWSVPLADLMPYKNKLQIFIKL